MIVLNNILVATDFSESAAVAVTYGRDFARTFKARVHLVHLVEDVMVRYNPEVGIGVADLQKDLEASAWRNLQALVTDDDRKLGMVPVVQTCTNVANAIVDYAKSNAIDLIVTGTHGRGPLRNLLMGSVAERVVRTAPCPVLTVHAKERDFVEPDAVAVTEGARLSAGPR